MADSIRAREKEICRMLNTGLLACAGVFGAGRFFGIAGVSWAHILVVVLTLTVMLVFISSDVRGRSLCLAAVLVCIYIGAAAAGWETSFTFLRSYLPWLMGDSHILKEWRLSYELLQTLVVTMLCCPLELLIEKVQLLRIAAAVAAGIFLLFCLLYRVALPHAGVACLLLFMVTVYVQWIQEHWKKVRNGQGRSYLLWIAPFLAFYLLLVTVVPVSEKPYEWFWAKSIYRQIREAFYVCIQNFGWKGGEGFGMAFSGFSEEAKLHEELLTDAQEVMLIQAENGLAANIYLTGRVYDDFDGRQWSQTDTTEMEYAFLDAVETLYAVRAYDRKYQKDYLKDVRLDIRYEKFRTGFVFAPLKTWRIAADKKAWDYTWQGGTLYFEGYKGLGTSYSLRYYQLNMGREEFDLFLESGSDGKEERWKEILAVYREKITAEETAAYRQWIYDNYLTSCTLSEEAGKYLEEITKGADSPVEKLRAIERALSSYIYTQTPGQLPDKVQDAQSFLDYFLLESRRGYCTYFATAFVLLSRAEGIPARYVQGYCVPAQGEKEIVVYSNMAHAWPEAYIEGVGWIPFEPTPGYTSLRYTSWGLTRQRKETEEGLSAEEPEEESALEEKEEETELEIEPEDDEIEEVVSWRLPGFVIPTFLLACLLLFVMDGIFGRYRYQRMSTDEKYRREIAKNLRLLSWLGYVRTEGETLWELAERLHAQGISTDFIQGYERVLYAGEPADEKMTGDAVEERGRLLETVRMEKKWLYVRFRLWLFWSRYR